MSASCADCEQDPAQREYWGCDGYSDGQHGPWIDEINGDTYAACPWRFVPESVLEWFVEFNYYESFPGTAPKYDHAIGKFTDAVHAYRAALREFQVIANGRTLRTEGR